MLSGIVFDALNPPALAAFWREATRGLTYGLELWFEPAAAPKEGKNRVHLDLAGGPDPTAEVERLLELGAARIDIGQGDVPWDVLADPEGNEFCVLRAGHANVMVDGGLSAVCLDVAADELAAQSDFWLDASGWPHLERLESVHVLRPASDSPIALLLGPPASARDGRNRVRLELTDAGRDSGVFTDPAGNEYRVRGARP
jgi:hypothetical protein